MSFTLTAKDYAEYIKLAYELIHSKGDYITELDSVTVMVITGPTSIWALRIL